MLCYRSWCHHLLSPSTQQQTPPHCFLLWFWETACGIILSDTSVWLLTSSSFSLSAAAVVASSNKLVDACGMQRNRTIHRLFYNFIFIFPMFLLFFAPLYMYNRMCSDLNDTSLLRKKKRKEKWTLTHLVGISVAYFWECAVFIHKNIIIIPLRGGGGGNLWVCADIVQVKKGKTQCFVEFFCLLYSLLLLLLGKVRKKCPVSLSLSLRGSFPGKHPRD